MIRCRWLAFGFVFLLLPSLYAQRLVTGDVRVQVTYSDNHPVPASAHVRIMSGASTSALADGYTDDRGTVEFHGLPAGSYNVVVSGEGLPETTSSVFEVDPGRASQSVYVRVERRRDETRASSASTVAVADLNIPEAAAREFDKATRLLARNNFEKAIHLLRKALQIYPKYAAAYNNLGVAYARLGQPAEERAALLKAVEVNDHFAAAYANLGRMAIKEGNFADAERWLSQASAAEPRDSQVLVMLANVELLNQNYDDALATCRRIHIAESDPHALAHYIAARALEGKNRPADAVRELETFLKEDPSGVRADEARKEIAQMQARITAASR
jgi:Flp pilus assembly protein TadD